MHANAPALPPARRLVLDTNVWLDLLLFEDPRCAGLTHALQSGRAVALCDAACREEWRRVLAYPALRLSAQQQTSLNARFDALAQLQFTAAALPSAPLPRCRDPDDQKFLELALHAKADGLVSRDDALLELAARARRAGLFDIYRPEQALP